MPYYRFEFDVPLSAAEVSMRLQSITRAPRGFMESIRHTFDHSEPDRPFVGKVDGATFRVQRDIRYHNSFLPLISGHIEPAPTGSRVRVNMFLHPIVALFVIFWLAAVGVAAWRALASPGATGIAGAAIPLAMFVFGLALTVGGFIPEAIKAKRLLLERVANMVPNNALEQNARPGASVKAARK